MKAGKSKKCKRENLCQGRNTEIVAVKSVQSKEKINCNEGSREGRGTNGFGQGKQICNQSWAIFSPQVAPGYPFASVNWKSKLLRKSIRSELGSWQVGSISQVSFIALLIVVGKHWAGKCHFLFPDLEQEVGRGGGFSVVNLCICQATFSWNFQSLFILRVSCLNVPLIREDNNKQAHLTICGARAAHEKHIQIRRPKVTNKQTSRQANQSLPWDRPNPNWTRKKGPGSCPGFELSLVERGQFNRLIYLWKPNALVPPPLPGPLLQPHNGLCGRHEIEIAKKSQFYRHARVTWPFEWMWTLTDTRTQVDGVEIPDKHFAVYLPSKHMSYSMLVLIANPLSPSTP